MRGGGSVLGVSTNHSVVDGSGCLDFLLHWSRTHRGLDHRAPSHDRALLDGLAVGVPPAPDDSQYAVVTGRAKFGFIWRVNARARRVKTFTVRFSSAEVLALRETARAGGDHARATSGDALSAHIWRVLGAIRDREPAATERLGVVVGLRAPLSEHLPHGYGGNAVSNTTAALPARALREEPLAHTASAVREALDRVTPQRIREEAAFLEAQRRAGRVNRVLSRMALDSFVDTVSLNNVSRLPVYAIEFGAGPAVLVRVPRDPRPVDRPHHPDPGRRPQPRRPSQRAPRGGRGAAHPRVVPASASPGELTGPFLSARRTIRLREGSRREGGRDPPCTHRGAMVHIHAADTLTMA